MKLINEQMGVTVIVITHDMELVGNYCNSALVFNGGLKVFDGPVRRLFTQDELLTESHLEKPYWYQNKEKLSAQNEGQGPINNLKQLYQYLKEKKLYGIY